MGCRDGSIPDNRTLAAAGDIMGAVVLTGHVDEHHRLSADVPESIAPGPVVISILPAPHEDEAGDVWAAGIAHEWADDLGDPRKDIDTLEDGEPVRES